MQGIQIMCHPLALLQWGIGHNPGNPLINVDLFHHKIEFLQSLSRLALTLHEY